MFSPEPFDEIPVSPMDDEDIDSTIEEAEAEYANNPQSYSARDVFVQLRKKHGIK